MRTLFFCKFPPPYTGMTIGTKTFAGLLDGAVEVERMNVSYGTIRPDRFGLEWMKYHVSFAGQLVGAYRELKRRLEQRDVDSFYFVASPSVFGHWRDRVAVGIARRRVEQVIAHVHNGNFAEVFEQSGTVSSAQRMVQSVDTFVFSNRVLSDRASAYIPAPKRAVVPNTVDESVRFTEEEVAEKIARRSQRDELRVLFLSNMIETKGYGDVAEAVDRFNAWSGRDARVDFVGDWPSRRTRSAFERRYSGFEHPEAIHVHGRLTDRRAVKRMFARADVFALPTYYPREAQPFAIIEAMNAGTPVVSTRHASIPEFVTDNDNGYLVEKKAPEQILDCLRLLGRRSNWTEKAWAARRTYRDMFSPEAVREQLLRVFEDPVPSTTQ